MARRPKNFFSAQERDVDDTWEPVKDPKPTLAHPGSLEKIAVLKLRLENGQHLWSDFDKNVFRPQTPLRSNHNQLFDVSVLMEGMSNDEG